MARSEAEAREDIKQVLTYVMVRRHRGRQLLSYRRGQYNRVEDYLRGSRCIGFGGHTQDSDRTLFNRADMGVTGCAARELREELALPAADRVRLEDPASLVCSGILNDDSSAVGRRHIALLFTYDVVDDDQWENPARGERSINQLRWIEPSSADLRLHEYEYWSQLCLREFHKRGVQAQPSFRIINAGKFPRHHALCVLGGIGSGKTETTRTLVSEHGYRELNSGSTLAGLLDLAPIPATPRAVFQTRAWEFISSPDGPQRLGCALAEAANRAGGRVLIDGIRQNATLEVLMTRLELPLAILFVHTAPDIAHSFYEKREANHIGFSEFLRLREAPVEQEVDEMIGLADAVLYNWTGKDEYRKTITEFMQRIGRS